MLVLAAAACLAVAGCEKLHTDHGRAGGPPKPVPVKPFDMGSPDVVLLVTGGTQGRMEVCNCSGPMAGGLARRNGLIQSYRAAYRHCFVIDIGEAFWVESGDIRNDFLMRGYRQIGYDAVVLAHHEWAAWPKHLPKILATTGIGHLSTTVEPSPLPKDWMGRKVFKRRWGDVRLAVVSDLRRESLLFVPEETIKQLRFRPREELAELVAELKRDGYVVVVAVPMDAEGVEATARAVKGDLILRGYTQRSVPKIMSVAGVPVAKIGGQETVGVVAMKVAGGKITELELRLEGVDTRWPMDNRLIQTYQAYAHAAMRLALDAKRKKPGLDHLASSGCGKCHVAQYKKWKKTRHSRAWKTLVKVRATGNPNCVMCHTSGFGTKKGFHTIEKTPQLAGVNCQDCHRFNDAEHRRKGFQFPPVTEDTCTSCHTPVTDPKFKHKVKLAKVRCPKSPAVRR